MKKYLPDMNRLVNLEELNLYLMSENAIGDNDLPKLTVSGQISKPQALLYLQQIIVGRGAFEQFLTALENSSNDHPGHKELHTKMMEERGHRMSNAGTYCSITPNRSCTQFTSLSEQGEGVASSDSTMQQVVADVRSETLVKEIKNQSSNNAEVKSSQRNSISNQASNSGVDLEQISEVKKLLRQKRKGIHYKTIDNRVCIIGHFDYVYWTLWDVHTIATSDELYEPHYHTIILTTTIILLPCRVDAAVTMSSRITHSVVSLAQYTQLLCACLSSYSFSWVEIFATAVDHEN